ncbi:hypothetical protein WCLP8_1640002 [uncultured Gammaproteobacteria bacterium]
MTTPAAACPTRARLAVVVVWYGLVFSH